MRDGSPRLGFPYLQQSYDSEFRILQITLNDALDRERSVAKSKRGIKELLLVQDPMVHLIVLDRYERPKRGHRSRSGRTPALPT